MICVRPDSTVYSCHVRVRIWPAAYHLPNAYCYYGRLGVIILLRVRCRQKYIFLFFSERKFQKVKRTFLTPSRHPLNRFSWNLASLLWDSFPWKLCQQFLFSFLFSNNHHFFKGSADDLSPLTFSYCHKWTNACVKNLRHGFLVERVKKQKCYVYRSLPLILSGTGVEFTQTHAFAKNVSITLSLTILRFSKERAIIWNY